MLKRQLNFDDLSTDDHSSRCCNCRQSRATPSSAETIRSNHRKRKRRSVKSKALPYITRYTVRNRRVEDTDEFHDTESEEMFGRRVDAMDRAEAQLVESTPRVATIVESWRKDGLL